MLSFELIQAIAKLRGVIRPDSYLFEILSRLSGHLKGVIEGLGNIVLQGGPEPAWQHTQIAIKQINAIAEVAREIKHRALFSELTKIEEAINSFSKETGVEAFSTGLIPTITEFSSAYERFISRYSHAQGLEFVITSQQLYQVLLSTIATLDTASQSLESDEQQPKQSEGELFIILHPEMEISKVTAKLNALTEIYYESCQLLNISYKEYPLRIAKMESGSLWLKLFGHNRVVTFILSLIDRGISYFHRNYTREGKIEAIPKRIEVIDDVLGLRNRLAAEGIETAQMEDNIAKSGIKISEQLNRLLGDEAVISINRVTYSVGQEVEKKYVEESRHLLLDSPREDENASDEQITFEDDTKE